MNQILYAFDPEAPSEARDLAEPQPEIDFASIEQRVRHLKSSGFDGVELLISAALATRLGPGLPAVIERAGIPAPVLAMPWLFPERPADWKATDSEFHHTDHFAPGTGAKLMVLRLIRPAGLALDDARKNLTGALIQAANHFEPRGINVAVEFRDGGVLGSYSEAMDWLYFHAPQAGLAVDAESLSTGGEEPYRAITELGPAVKLVYLNAAASATLDHPRLFTALKTANCPAPVVLRGALDDADLRDRVSSLRQMLAGAPVKAVAITES